MKLIIIEACLIAMAGAAVAQPAAVGETVDVPKDDAGHYLVRLGRALYLDKQDDPTKGLSTADKEDLDRVKRQAKAIEESAAASRAANTPPNLGDLLAGAVAQGMQIAFAQQAAAQAAAASKPAGT